VRNNECSFHMRLSIARFEEGSKCNNSNKTFIADKGGVEQSNRKTATIDSNNNSLYIDYLRKMLT
jgi:hypothetical protein